MTACGQPADDAGAGVPEMTFRVEAALLGEPVCLDSLGVAFAPPAGWVPATTRAALPASTRAAEGAGVAVEPVRLFFDEPTRGLMSVSRLALAPGGGALAAYADALTGPGARLDAFRSNTLVFHQVVDRRDEWLAFTLLVEAAPDAPLRFDYVVPHDHYTDVVRQIESSIGSIRPSDRRAPQP